MNIFSKLEYPLPSGQLSRITGQDRTCHAHRFIFSPFFVYFFRAMLCISAAWPVPSCGVRLSVTFVNSVETADISASFFITDSHTILVFFTPNVMAIFRRGPS